MMNKLESSEKKRAINASENGKYTRYKIEGFLQLESAYVKQGEWRGKEVIKVDVK